MTKPEGYLFPFGKSKHLDRAAHDQPEDGLDQHKAKG
jgi:hypothetical protein